jgi:hypothetical protein
VAVINDNNERGAARLEKATATVENSQGANGNIEGDSSSKPDELKKEGERTKMSFLLN